MCSSTLINTMKMEPHIGRIAFNIAILLVTLILIALPFLNTQSAEFVTAVLALIISLVFLFLIAWDVRRQARGEILKRQKLKSNGNELS